MGRGWRRNWLALLSLLPRHCPPPQALLPILQVAIFRSAFKSVGALAQNFPEVFVVDDGIVFFEVGMGKSVPPPSCIPSLELQAALGDAWNVECSMLKVEGDDWEKAGMLLGLVANGQEDEDDEDEPEVEEVGDGAGPPDADTEAAAEPEAEAEATAPPADEEGEAHLAEVEAQIKAEEEAPGADAEGKAQEEGEPQEPGTQDDTTEQAPDESGIALSDDEKR